MPPIKVINYELKSAPLWQNIKLSLSESNMAEGTSPPVWSVSKISFLTHKNLQVSIDNQHFYFTSHEEYPFGFGEVIRRF
jgi:hypothetical protein